VEIINALLYHFIALLGFTYIRTRSFIYLHTAQFPKELFVRFS